MPVPEGGALVIIEAPSNLGLMPPDPGAEPGTRGAPDALRRLGLHDRLRPRKVLRVAATPYEADDERAANIRNLDAIAHHAVRLADTAESTLREHDFPLVLGGDCSILVGVALGLHRVGEAGLLFIDGHSDFYLPEQSQTGGAAGMDLALATGWGPRALTDLEGRRPYIDARRVASLGNRDHHPRPRAPIPDIGDGVGFYRPRASLRGIGLEVATREALSFLASNGAGFWIHLDVDVLDEIVMPAVDSPQPDGLSFDELEILLTLALGAPAIGMTVTIYDPDRDPGGVAGRRLVALLAAVLRAAGRLPAV